MTTNRRIEYVPLDKITSAARNPKKHAGELVQASIGRFGMASPPVVDERTGRLVAGHGRIEALVAMRDAGQQPPEGISSDDDGQWLIPIYCGWASRSDAEAEAYVVADNRHTELGGWDHESLAQLLDDIGDSELVELSGWDLADLGEILDPGDESLPDAGDADTGPSAIVWGVSVTCRNETEQVQLLERLTGEGYDVRALM